MKDKNFVVVMCPPYPDYPVQPKDQSHCELFDCPNCKGKMWLSERKKEVFTFADGLKKEIILGCYKCIEKLVKSNPEIFF